LNIPHRKHIDNGGAANGGKKFIQSVTKVRGMAHRLLGGADAHRQDVICGSSEAKSKAVLIKYDRFKVITALCKNEGRRTDDIRKA
jgi:hypothetical protein